MRLDMIQHWARVHPEHAARLPMLAAGVWYPIVAAPGLVPDAAPRALPGFLWLVADGLFLNVAQRHVEVQPGPPGGWY